MSKVTLNVSHHQPKALTNMKPDNYKLTNSDMTLSPCIVYSHQSARLDLEVNVLVT